MPSILPCPQCQSPYAYEDRDQLVCPECTHEWKPGAVAEAETAERVVRDSNGNVLSDGDTVTVIKDQDRKFNRGRSSIRRTHGAIAYPARAGRRAAACPPPRLGGRPNGVARGHPVAAGTDRTRWWD